MGPDVSTECSRVESCQDELRIVHVSKSFGATIAVQDVTFGVPEGEIFALLGPNGAGKSTIISLISGDDGPTDHRSEILVANISMTEQKSVARANLGVCSQFDALDQLATAEHLRFYARAKGVNPVETNVDCILHAVGLASFKNRMAFKLSGGNKRKLSLAIALIGNPSVMILDEPSSGMDVVSKRVMWRTLQSISAGRSLLLTTHSMEEADALANRTGIMSRSMLTIGSSAELRQKYGNTWRIHLVHRDAPHTSENSMNDIKRFILRKFATATIEDRSFHGQLRFSVANHQEFNVSSSSSAHHMPASNLPGGLIHDRMSAIITSNDGDERHDMYSILNWLELSKKEVGIRHYSVESQTMDQVFLSVVGRHNAHDHTDPHTTTSLYRFKQRARRDRPTLMGRDRAGFKQLTSDEDICLRPMRRPSV